MSLREATPREDWESLRWVVKKSVSSYTARSGDVEVEETEAVSLTWGVVSRSRAMCCLRRMRGIMVSSKAEGATQVARDRAAYADQCVVGSKPCVEFP